MTVRISVSLPDDVHADLVRIAASSNISAASVIRAVLSDIVPKMSGMLEYLGNVKPSDAPAMLEELDAWSADLRVLLHDAPPALGSVRRMFDEKPEGDEVP